jgi:16S rRNA (guanine966-N2)-methyltransferase
VSKKHRPPQSTQMISSSGWSACTTPVCRYRAAVRVVAGELRGRTIVAPEGTSTRPTTDKVREAMFNALRSLGVVDGAVVADLFAGCGALGIEALSRGASSCVFVERDATALRVLRSNLHTLGLDDRSRVVAADVLSTVSSLSPIDLALVDPPYAFDDWDTLLGRLRAGLVVAESDREIAAPPGWESTRARRYGRTWVTFLERVP